MNNPKNKAILRSAAAPNEKNRERLLVFLKKTYQQDVELEWQEDEHIQDGFLLQVGTDIYDWTIEGRLRQFKERLEKLPNSRDDIIPLMKESVENWTPEVTPEEIGEVISVGDNIATISGLEHAAYGEILLFPSGIKGMVQDLKPGEIGCILFGDAEEVSEGSIVRRSGRMAGIPVGDAFLGRVVDALGNPIDGKGQIEAADYRPIEMPAPEIIDRQPVNQPMETGLLAIDSMFPIGRGQRELIIGDRQTGKTAIALDTILNQKGKDVICIYVAIGQKASSGGTAGGDPTEARRDGVFDRRQRLGQRLRNPAVHRTLCRLRAGRIFHVQGQGRADRLRRPFQARRGLPGAEPAAGALSRP